MPKTLTPGDNKKDERNIGQDHSDRLVNRLNNTEQAGTVDMSDFERNYGENADSSQEDANIDKLRDKEASSAPTPGWRNDVTEPGSKKGKITVKGWFKKSGPFLGIGGILGIGTLVLIGLTSPSLLIVQLKETMVGRFNTQLSSMEARTNKILYAKMNGATSGFCNEKLTIRCKYTTMSEKQVAKLKAAGIEVTASDSKTITGRIKPASLTFKGQTITPASFATTAGTNVEFRNALKQAYNPKYAGFVGKAWANVAGKYKINKQAPELNADEDPEKARAKINEIAKEGTEDTGSRIRIDGDPNCETAGCISEADAEKANTEASGMSEAAKNGSAANDVRARLSGINSGAVGSFFKLSAPLDYACQGYGALTTLSYAGKAIRAAQLVRYSVIFAGVADAIKAGISPEPEDVELLGSILTTTIADENDATKTAVGDATSSFGYRYAAYGDSGGTQQSMQIANRFIAGGGFVGELSTVTATITSLIGGRDNAKATCGFLANPVVQGASIVLGIASLFVPGANVGKVIASAAAGAAAGVALAIIPSMLADIVAGTVTQDIVGEEAGNAIASGSGALMSDSLAAQNGNAPMSKSDALAYNNLQAETNDQYIADELENTSPFDATNPHTFVGSMVAQLLPLQSKSNPLTTLGSFLNSSVRNLTPSSSALTTAEYEKALNVCQDLDVVEAGYAADPFCNVIRGIPPKYLDRDPFVVIEWLIANGYLTSDETPTQKYTDFINQCMLNEEPLGYKNMDTGFDKQAAQDCVIDDGNANLYLGFLDGRVELGLSDEDDADATPTTTAGSTDKKALAAKIVAKGKVQYLGGVKPVLEQIADGTIDPNAQPCGININILRMIDMITDKHSIKISDINRNCTSDVPSGSSVNSRHYAGNGSAIDIAVIDGAATTGRDANALSIINMLLPMLGEIGTSAGSYSGLGQINCGPTPSLPAGVDSFEDGCHHLHIDVPAKSDPALQYNPAGW